MKQELYSTLEAQLNALIEGEHDEVGIMANAAALLHEAMGERFFWTGFYVVKNGELALGPFQGSVACMHIAQGRGVCGTAWKERRTIVVDDVELFPGHIACSALSRSEIVVPLIDGVQRVRAVLDIDSRNRAAFDDIDKAGLEKIAAILSSHLYNS